jgi:DNA-binding PadR family transcriptional regulator
MAARSPTTLEFALLGLIRQAPRSGYDLRKIFDTTPMGNYSSSPGAIYPALRRLKQKGLIEAAMDRTKRLRSRELFAVTPQGEKSMRAWLCKPVTRETVIWEMDEIMLRFALMEDLLANEQVRIFLESLARECQRYAQELKGTVRELKGSGNIYGRLAVESGLEEYEAKARWARRALGALASAAKQHKGRRSEL